MSRVAPRASGRRTFRLSCSLNISTAELTSKLKVPKLADFYAYEGDWFQKRRWFDPAKALTLINTLYDYLERHPGDLGFEPDASCRHWPEMLMRELLECRRTLEGAVASGSKFRFLIVS
jgi:hypothetical protein